MVDPDISWQKGCVNAAVSTCSTRDDRQNSVIPGVVRLAVRKIAVVRERFRGLRSIGMESGEMIPRSRKGVFDG